MLKSVTLAGVASCLVMFSPVFAQDTRRLGGDSPRVSTRMAYVGSDSGGQFAIDYGQPEWKAEYEAQFEALTKGKRWRLGNNFWTTLDTHLDLYIGGIPVKAGYYYLVLERSESDEWRLILLDPKIAREKRLFASMANQTSGGLEAPLKWEQVEETASKLEVRLIPDETDLNKTMLEIRWGKHKLTTSIEVNL